MKRGKKGSLMDLMFIIFILFALVLVLFVTKNFFSDLTGSWTGEGGVLADSNTSLKIMDSGTGTIDSFNWLVPLAFIFLIIVISILAYNQEVTQGTLFLGIFLVLVLTVIAGALGDSFQSISESGEFVNETATFSAPTHMMSNFGMYIFFGGIIVLVAMYISLKRSSGGIE